MMNTRSPCAASRRAQAAPTPVPPPVITTTLFMIQLLHQLADHQQAAQQQPPLFGIQPQVAAAGRQTADHRRCGEMLNLHLPTPVVHRQPHAAKIQLRQRLADLRVALQAVSTRCAAAWRWRSR